METGFPVKKECHFEEFLLDMKFVSAEANIGNDWMDGYHYLALVASSIVQLLLSLLLFYAAKTGRKHLCWAWIVWTLFSSISAVVCVVILVKKDMEIKKEWMSPARAGIIITVAIIGAGIKKIWKFVSQFLNDFFLNWSCQFVLCVVRFHFYQIGLREEVWKWTQNRGRKNYCKSHDHYWNCYQRRPCLNWTINLPGGCVKCPLRELIEGQLSAWASLAKNENVYFGKISTSFLQNLFTILIGRV